MNKRDIRLIEFCKGRPKTIREISDYLGIAIKNVHIKIRSLEEEGILKIRKSNVLKMLVVQTKQDREFSSEMLRVLKIIKDNGGEMENNSLFDKAFEGIDVDSQKGELLSRVLLMLPSYEGIEEMFKLNDKGQEFLKKEGLKGGQDDKKLKSTPKEELRT